MNYYIFSGTSSGNMNTDLKSVQPTLESTIEKVKIWDINNPRAKEITTAIAEMIAVDNQPFSIVEDMGFVRLLKRLRPLYQPPSRRYITEKIMPEIYQEIRKVVENQMNDARFISLTTDIWTSNSNESFIALTGHSLTDDFQQRQCVLRVKPVPGSHTSEYISENLLYE